ncbi:MAG: SAM-dependent chlorinase/fluorinase [Gemmatimonadales bacterium]|jgi:S-adenosylmethionine hydrolase
MTIVTLLSDFGTRDGFTAAVKGVVLSIAPQSQVVDAAHDVARGDIVAAAWVLFQYWTLYPAGSVHLAVVDPSVGSARRALALRANERFVVAPDNGLVTRVLAAATDWRCVEIREPRFQRPAVSHTFHGRDVFAPVAAHLANGVSLEELGPPLVQPVRLPLASPVRSDREIRGSVVHIDGFGNLISDIPAEWIDERWDFAIGEWEAGALSDSYSAVDTGGLVVVISSQGTVEIAARDASAAKKLGVARGDPVIGWRRRA